MPLFSYKAVREDGSSVSDQAIAADAAQLRQELESRGYLVLEVGKKSGHIGRISGSAKDFLLFNQEFVTLFKAGLPILQSLEILQKRTEKPAFRTVLENIIVDIKGGSSLSDAMAKHPAYFSPLYTSSIRAGEKSGALTDVLKRFNTYQKRMLAVRRKLVTSLLYPTIVVFFVLAVLLLFIFYIIPNFTEMYSDQDASLPALTTFLISLTQSLTRYSPLVFVLVLALTTGIYFWQKNEAAKAKLDYLKLKLPIFGSLLTEYTIAQLARTLATVLKGGIPLVQALDATAEAINNKLIARRLLEARKLVTEGSSLANAFEQTRLAPDITIRMIEVGESSGDLPQMLEDIADFYEDTADGKIPVLTTLIEVIIIAFLGLIVAFIVIALYLPIFEMGSRL